MSAASLVLKKMLEQQTWCVVGSHGRNPICDSLVSKLRSQGKVVHALNPRNGGLEALKTLSPAPTVINLVVNPQLGLQVVQEMHDSGVGSMLFVQPGAEFQDMERVCADLNIEELYTGCVLIDS